MDASRHSAVDRDVAVFAAGRVRDHTGVSVSEANVRLLGSRHDYWVLECAVSGPHADVTMKLAGPEAAFPVDFGGTAAVMALVGDAGVPVAHVLGADDSYHMGPWRYLLQERVPGQQWREIARGLPAREVRAAHREIARVLLLVQSVTFESYGPVDSNGRPIPAQDLLTALMNRADKTIRDARARTAFLDVLQRNAQLFFGHDKPTLCHDDLHHGNVLFAPSDTGPRLTAVLDWDKSWSGPSESDVARLAMWDDMTGPGFWDVYRAQKPPAEGEAARRLIYQLLWCLEYDAKTRRHRDDTRRLCGSLGVSW